MPHLGVLSYASGGGGVHSKAWEEGLAKARQLRKIRRIDHLKSNWGSEQFLGQFFEIELQQEAKIGGLRL